MLSENQLKPYQLEARDYIENLPFCGVFLEMGLGKTVITLTALRNLFASLMSRKALVIAPKRVAETVWSDEIKNWEHLQDLKISIIAGSEKQRIKALRAEANVYTLGRDNVDWLVNYTGAKFPFDTVIIDESSSFKNHKSKRFKALKKIRPLISRLVILTGTPSPNSLLELWPQIYLLDQGARLGRFITNYRDIYFTPGQRNGAIIFNYKLKPGADKLIQDKIKDICISMKSEDYLTLPGRTYNDILIHFPDKIREQYESFEREQILELSKGGEITALNAAAVSNKLLQMANGAVYDENRAVHHVHDLKIDACKEIVEAAAGRPVLIAWIYKHDRDRLKEALKEHKPRELQDGKDIYDWNAGQIQVLLTHPASGGHGLNLQFGGHLIVWFGQTWSLELYQQFNARLDRPGQENKVIIHRLIADNTIDQDVIKAQDGKQKGQEALMQAMKLKIKKYA